MSKQAKVVLSLDYGTKKIGICVAETFTGQTKPLPVIKNNNSLFENLNRLHEDWRPNLILIGVPPKMTEDFMDGLIRTKNYFVKKLKIEVVEINEDFTTQGLNKDKKRHMKDSYSAELIFQDWFNNKDG
ncbi:MAG: pre-16S rRNA-processing nuclease YqgF [Gammaproteobacteria bacterium TMED112]|nr:MAG: pre-16S rRNA-processing nuclease YqgF [Gammaproteobacteria bacterium TMED112]